MTVSSPPFVELRFPPTATLRVLVVEDDPDSAESIAELVQSCGHLATIAPDGERALEQIVELDPDVVLLDIGLPGIDGWELASRIERRGMPPRPLVLALSACAPDRDRAHASGVLFYFRKPAGIHSLRDVLARFGRSLVQGRNVR